MDNRTIVILGITGSIGIQTVEVIQSLGNFHILGGTYHKNKDLADAISQKHNLSNLISTSRGYDLAIEMLEKLRPDITLVAIPGFSSLILALKAIEVSKRVLLASKEALVCGGWLIKEKLKNCETNLIPVDSEHTALMQIYEEPFEEVIITSSGGALRDWELHNLHNAKPKDVLKHPVWKMGERITVDSATMVNKAFEVFEASEYFNIPISKIRVLIHKEGIVHAGILLCDSTIKLHLGFADMKVPIAYALTYPERKYKKPSWPDLVNTNLSFENVDETRYPAFKLLYEISENYAKRTAYNASDEIAVQNFLKEKIKFTDIPKVIEKVVESTNGQVRDLKDLIQIDKESRKKALEVIRCL
ncbi:MULTISPECIES: 1-deoxy-D-xylulose-5-phosphate reductoisomerase [Pseudothermotoga]|jgi:1-deoxy-D-xylulose-5-phosphate reductoisomerase|uniref:1-deoxy-D-xylulose-5-phosphate reductoisomerase n=1 Tax=Pseudothermotoga TaxID=1643951 RepID=UPI000406507D|nr:MULTISPECIES: 1-deoxy-D-xylulose-5-phosphate reductoisomerase [Pseudothermotoga]MDI3495615.1 1-deoxy-D-xylulose-5-phosphate reductoisomerase [Pseudothermotoga sp.]HBJ81834.1 1-deoxy-D-xylulose-5-phosphate reductoisomerase [Pseudothermotoga sp.]